MIMDINYIINNCGNLLQPNQDVAGHIEKLKKSKDNYHDETMLTLMLATAFAADKVNDYAGVSSLLGQVISYRKSISSTSLPVLTKEHSVFIEYQTPNLKHYNNFVRENWVNAHFPKHLYNDRRVIVEERLERGDKHDLEGSTHFDMVITNPNKDKVYFECKYISDIDCKTKYIPCRDQLSRCLDAALCDATDKLTNPDGLQHFWFFLLTPEMFRIEEFGGSIDNNRIFHPERSRLYSYKMRDFADPMYLEYNFPHLPKSIDLKLLSERIFWMTWEEATYFVVHNILDGEKAEFVKSFFKERNLLGEFNK